jgi:hypothetical protein
MVSSWRRRAAPLLLLAAALGSYFMIAPTRPRDQDVSLDLGTVAPDVTSIQVVWSRPGSSDEPAVSTRWHFAAGNAPRRLQTRMRLGNGPWIADVDLDRVDAGPRMHWSRQVNLTGDPMTLPLHEVTR